MLDIRQRRPVELASSVSTDGPLSDPTPSEPHLIPGTLAACPAECTPRPRNLPAYRAACHAAQGEAVHEFDAAEIVPDMRVWSGARFLSVAEVEHKCVADIKDVLATEAARAHLYVELRLDGAEASGWLLAEPDAPVYCLA